MKYIDLTGIIEPGMWGYGAALPEVKFTTCGSLEKEGWVSHAITMSAITGTYLETAGHMIENSRTIDQILPEELMTEALVIHAPKKPNEYVTRAELEPSFEKLHPGHALVVNTSWYHYWNKDNFTTESPYFSNEAIDLILEHDISILASDMYGYDHPQAESMDQLLRIFKKDMLILTALINLDKIESERVTLMAFPLKFKDLNASPCRVIVVED